MDGKIISLFEGDGINDYFVYIMRGWMKHLAYEYARRGACLVVAARREKSLREIAEIASFLGSPYAIPVRADVSKLEDCQRLIETAIQHFGQCKYIC